MAREPRRNNMSGQAMQRLTEANVARLGLISIQERIPPGFTRWDVDFEVDGQPGHLSCFSPAEYGGVPHGLDGDIANALIDLFIEQDAPDTGLVTTTASALLLRAGLHNNGHYHRALTESMRRLKQATYTMSHAWRDHAQRKWTSGTFSYVLAYELTSSERETVTEGAILAVTLAGQIVKSIQARYVKPLDYVFLTSLERPLTRALFRLLDAKRHDPQDLTRVVASYTVNLLEWAAECKIVDKRTDKVRRTLDGAHDELVERGYLKTVSYEGRGRKQQLTYLFGAQAEDVPDVEPAMVSALVAQRVARGVARGLVEKFGEVRVQGRLEKFQALLASGYQARNPSALLVDVIRDDAGKYGDPVGVSALAVPALQAVRKPQTPQTDDDADQLERSRHEAFRQLSLEDQAEQALRTLTLLLKGRLDTAQYAKLRTALATGRADAATVVKAVTRAVYEGQLDRAVQDLRTLAG